VEWTVPDRTDKTTNSAERLSPEKTRQGVFSHGTGTNPEFGSRTIRSNSWRV